MSRLSVGEAVPECDVGMLLCYFLEEIHIGARDILEATNVDPTLFLILKYTMEGWPRCLYRPVPT